MYHSCETSVYFPALFEKGATPENTIYYTEYCKI